LPFIKRFLSRLILVRQTAIECCAMHRIITTVVISFCACMLSTGCSQGPTVDEAWRVGYDMGIADECGREGERREPMPSAYDDSTSANELASAFQNGYWTARRQEQPCKYGPRRR
jgi:hypothetical protein